jgi:hypothetical protein
MLALEKAVVAKPRVKENDIIRRIHSQASLQGPSTYDHCTVRYEAQLYPFALTYTADETLETTNSHHLQAVLDLGGENGAGWL